MSALRYQIQVVPGVPPVPSSYKVVGLSPTGEPFLEVEGFPTLTDAGLWIISFLTRSMSSARQDDLEKQAVGALILGGQQADRKTS